MSEVMVLVEGPTEQILINSLIRPFLAQQGVYLYPTIPGKTGENGGDVRFAKYCPEIQKHLKQRPDIYVTLMVDYYGIGMDWPGLGDSKTKATHQEKAFVVNEATAEAIQSFLPDIEVGRRFIPYVSMHETETLYFSSPEILAERLGISHETVQQVLNTCGEAEKVNDGVTTAPSKRLEDWNNRFKKTTTGIAIAQEIGVPLMRAKCPLFDAWITTLERLGGV